MKLFRKIPDINRCYMLNDLHTIYQASVIVIKGSNPSFSIELSKLKPFSRLRRPWSDPTGSWWWSCGTPRTPSPPPPPPSPGRPTTAATLRPRPIRPPAIRPPSSASPAGRYRWTSGPAAASTATCPSSSTTSTSRLCLARCTQVSSPCTSRPRRILLL